MTVVATGFEPGTFEPNAIYRTADIMARTGWSKWTVHRLKVQGVLVPRQAVKGGTCFYLGADILAAFASSGGAPMTTIELLTVMIARLAKDDPERLIALRARRAALQTARRLQRYLDREVSGHAD